METMTGHIMETMTGPCYGVETSGVETLWAWSRVLMCIIGETPCASRAGPAPMGMAHASLSLGYGFYRLRLRGFRSVGAARVCVGMWQVGNG